MNVEFGNFIFVVARGEIDEVPKNDRALKFLITDKKTDACANFDTFIILPDDENFPVTAEKIISCVKSSSEDSVVDIDFEDMQNIFKDSGETFFAIGEAETAVDAAKAVISKIDKLSKCRSIFLSFIGDEQKFSMLEVHEASTIIQESADSEAEIFWVMTSAKQNKVSVLVLATRETK